MSGHRGDRSSAHRSPQPARHAAFPLDLEGYYSRELRDPPSLPAPPTPPRQNTSDYHMPGHYPRHSDESRRSSFSQQVSDSVPIVVTNNQRTLAHVSSTRGYNRVDLEDTSNQHALNTAHTSSNQDSNSAPFEVTNNQPASDMAHASSSRTFNRGRVETARTQPSAVSPVTAATQSRPITDPQAGPTAMPSSGNSPPAPESVSSLSISDGVPPVATAAQNQQSAAPVVTAAMPFFGNSRPPADSIGSVPVYGDRVTAVDNQKQGYWQGRKVLSPETMKRHRKIKFRRVSQLVLSISLFWIEVLILSAVSNHDQRHFLLILFRSESNVKVTGSDRFACRQVFYSIL
jgi:hypothetical protein